MDIIYGIDPAFRERGFSICEINTMINPPLISFIDFEKLTDFIRWFMFDTPVECFSVIENSNLQNTTFLNSVNKSIQNKLSRDAGKNQAISQLVVDLFSEKYGAKNIINISPKTKGVKWTSAKVAIGFTSALGLELAESKSLVGSSAQDRRDALKLAIIGYNHLKTTKR